ncbi:MAG: transglycosylase SLT domain-containing protein [Bacteroidaceae bacterium]|nr:transglycosylase SLT domain-containing protein [Bacteroidaceae bacterium]
MRSILLITLLIFSSALSAQTQTTTAAEEKETMDLPETLLADMDSLYWDWQSKNYLFVDENCVTTTTNPAISDSVYIDRLSRIPSIIEMPFNDIVKKHIEAYTNRLRNKVSFILAAANFYMPLFEEALDTYDLPLELKYLPIIESALNPTAISRQRASGLWQFMLRTGKLYGLENNSLVDERRDPIKSTWAAARYLKDLYNIYKDWHLVLAAYNCGPGNVNKAIRRAGGATDYWEIYQFLPKETRGYVPGFIAANYVMHYYCEHGICPMEAQLPATTDTIHIHKDLNLQQVAGVCNIDIEQLRSLNPQYKKDVVPGNSKPYVLRLPNNTVNQFIDLQDSIYAYKADQFQKRKTVAVKESTAKSSNSKNAKYHKIRRGDTLGGIALKYGVSVKQLRRLNNIRGNNITAGKSLRIR